jgi:hypothetical protein
MEDDSWLDDALGTSEEEQEEEEVETDEPLFPEFQTPAQVPDDDDDLLDGLSSEQIERVTQRVLQRVSSVTSREGAVNRILGENLEEPVLGKWKPLIDAAMKTIDPNVPLEKWHVYGSAYVAAMQSLPRKDMSMREVHQWIGKQFGLTGDEVQEDEPRPRPVQPSQQRKQAPTPPKTRSKRTGNIYMDSLAASYDITETDFAEVSAGRRR